MGSNVELVHVSKAFGGEQAVNDISVAIDGGSFFSLLGPSGCGKSTTLRMASGFEVPDRGEILIGGKDMSRVPAYRRPTNMVFQRWALFPHMSVYENVAFGLKVEHVRRPELTRRVAEALELVGLEAYAGRKPGQLSGGQMQRVALARAIVKRPEVLLLDEPLGALDLKLRLQMQLELKRIQRELDTTFIYVTHDQNEAMTMSDQIAVMNSGRIEQVGTPQEVYDKPASHFVANFIGHTNLFSARYRSQGDEVAIDAGGLRFTAVAPDFAGATGEARVSLRYERLKLGREAEGQPNRTLARVAETIFSGAAVQYVLDVQEAELNLIAEVPYSGGEPLYTVGTEVAVGWSNDAARIFPQHSLAPAATPV